MPKKKSKPAPPKTKAARVKKLLREMNAAMGGDGRLFMGRDVEDMGFERIESGVLAFDTITSGGICRRKYSEIYGPESAGKTTLALNIAASVQRGGGIVAWVIGEEFDDSWAEKNGVDLDKLIKIEAATGDLMLEAGSTALESGVVDLLVIDSVQVMGTQRELDAGIESESYAGGGAPQMWTRFMRRCRSLFNSRQSNAAILAISQAREAIGKFSPAGKPEPQPSQIRVLLHWKSVSVYCKKGEAFYADMKTDKRRITHRQFKLRCVKNKTGAPERVGSYIYHFTNEKWGIDKADEAIRLARVYGLITKKGKTLSGYGRSMVTKDGVTATEKFKALLEKKKFLLAQIQSDILAKIAEE